MSDVASGLVVPLVRIGQHFQGPSARHVIDALAWQEMAPIKKEPIIRSVMEGRPSPWSRIVAYTEKVDIEEVIHDAITLWLVECYRLLTGINTTKAPESTAEFHVLVKHMLDRESYSRYDGDDWGKLYSYFKKTILDIDENLLEIQANWGDSDS